MQKGRTRKNGDRKGLGMNRMPVLIGKLSRLTRDFLLPNVPSRYDDLENLRGSIDSDCVSRASKGIASGMA